MTFPPELPDNGDQDPVKTLMARVLEQAKETTRRIAEEKYPGYLEIADAIEEECAGVLKQFFDSLDEDPKFIRTELHFAYIAANILAVPVDAGGPHELRSIQGRLFSLIDDLIRHLTLNDHDKQRWDRRHMLPGSSRDAAAEMESFRNEAEEMIDRIDEVKEKLDSEEEEE